MNISETKTSYLNYQKPTSFKANGTAGGQTGGSGVLLPGAIAVASAAVAGVALYKNRKTGKALEEALTKLKNTENELKQNKDKIEETTRKLEEMSSKQTSKVDDETAEKGTAVKEWLKRQGEKGGKCLYKFGRFLNKKFNSMKTAGKSSSKVKKNKTRAQDNVQIGINDNWLREQMEIRQKSGEELAKTLEDLNQLKTLYKQYRETEKKLKKINNRTQKIKSKNDITKSDAEEKIKNLTKRIEELTNELNAKFQGRSGNSGSAA